MRRLLAVLVLALALAVSLPSVAFATDWFVATPADAGSDVTGDGSAAAPFATVQKAITVAAGSAGAPHRVYVGPGTYTGNVVMANGVSLYGAGAASTTLDAGGSGSVVAFQVIGDGETISGFTITGGSTDRGGGIFCAASSPTITGNIITGNRAGFFGGGICCLDSSASVTGNTITNNTADAGSGGGIMVAGSGQPTVSGNTVSGNSAPNGGGISVDQGAAILSGNTVAGNFGTVMGGGIFCLSSTASIEDNAVTGNSAVDGGGGICSYLSILTATDNTISGNTAGYGGGLFGSRTTVSVDANTLSGNQADSGGGIYLETTSGTITNNVMSGNDASYSGGALKLNDYSGPIADNTISGNTAGYGGGGLFIVFGSPSITGNSITDNSSGYAGGAMWLSACSSAISNNIIARHIPAPGAYGGALYCQAADPNLNGNTFVANGAGATGWGPIVLDVQCNAVTADCIIWGNGGTAITVVDPGTVSLNVSYSCIQGWTGGTGNIGVDPLFADAPAGDYRLTPLSPCIDTGTATGAPATDIRGVARPQGAGVDMGAYEFSGQSVTFDSRGGNTVAGQVVDLGSRVVRPAEPTRTGFTLGGWYTEAAYTNAWDFATPLTAPITLYAEWAPLPVTGMNPAYTMYVGDSLTIDAKPDGGTWNWDAAYFSATFNSPATFTALRAGSSVVAYTANGVTASATITVLARPASASTSARTLPATGANLPPTLLAALLSAFAGVALRVGARRA